MKTYFVRRDGRERRLTIRPLQENRFAVTIDGDAHEVDVRSYASDHLSMLIDNRSVEATYAFQGERLGLRIRNDEFEMDVQDERKKKKRAPGGAGHAAGPEIIKAAMPGKIVEVKVRAGDRIEPKAGVVVMEAMKMENEIAAPVSGTVKVVSVAAGARVAEGDPLVTIEPAAAV